LESIFKFLKTIDRRIIFLIIAVAVIVTLKIPMYLPVSVSKNASGFLELLDAVKENDAVIISFDYAASGEPELKPMAQAILYRLFQRKARVFMMAFWDQGPGLADNTVKGIIEKFEKHNPGRKIEYGKDFINLGYKVGASNVIIAMNKSIKDIFSKDNTGKPIEEFPIMKGIEKLKDFKRVFAITGGNNGLLDIWLPFARQQYQIPVCGGCTSVSAPQFYQYMQSKQLDGLLDGFKTAAELLKAIEYDDPATGKKENMLSKDIHRIADVQSVVHVIIILFIIIANATYFYEKKYGRANSK